MATKVRNPLSLAALRILVIEDEFFLADDVVSTLRAHGAEVLGPFATPAAAAQAIESGTPDCALLDLNLGGGELAFPLARRLRAARVPFLLATGYGAETLPEDLTDVPRLEKPFDAARAAEALAELLG